MTSFIAIFVLFYFAEGVVYPSIPAHLLECYRGGGPALGAPRRLDVLLSLLRTLEVNTQLDLRAFSAALLRSVRLDGIEQAANPVESEFVTPYRASAFQFHKYKLLMDLFVPSQNSLEVDGILTPDEKCLLHRMMSSTMYQWERGDEILTCPVSVEQRVETLTAETRNTRVVSRCPIEEGVIQTPWGTISPGVITSAVAAALEAQRVSISDILNADVFKAGLAEPMLENANEHWEDDIETLATAKSQLQLPNADISNVWVATLAGDLAEVAVNQGPRVGSAAQRLVIGSNNRWNDTILPRAYYLLQQNTSVVDWHFTDAEILAGIDGLILSQYVPTWVAQRNTLRLSQIIDMYYSNDGVSFDPSVKACNRRALYDKVFDRSQLLAEMSSFASVLSLSQGTVYMQADELDRICEAAVAAFVAYVPTILSENEHSCATSPSVPVVDVVVATDGSWKGYDVEQFLSWVGGAMELGLTRGSLSLLHGNTGAWIAPPCDNLTAVFSHIGNFTGSWPNRLNLPNILSTIIQHSRNQSLEESSAGTSVGPSTVLLIISPSDRISANDVETSRELMRSLRTSFFDVYFAYLAQDMTGFENVNNDYMDYSELFLKVDSITVQDAITSVKTDLLQHGIPMRIFGGHCPANDTQFPQRAYEDFVQPGGTNEYRIHPYYLGEQMVVSVVFRNGGGGSLLVCWWRGADSAHSCHTLETRQLHVFNITTPCPSADFCPPAHFTVSAAATLNLCANTDCRLPHQVGYYIEHSGLRCLALRSSATSIWPSFYMTLTFGLILLATKNI